MRARRVELAYDGHPPVRIRGRQVTQQILDDALRIAVDARRRAEYERGDARLAHHLDQRERAADVCVVVRERPRFRLGDVLEPGTVDDGGDRMVVEGGAQRNDVADVGRHAGYGPSRQRLETGTD